MNILKLDEFRPNIRTYGGASCKKLGITIDSRPYLVKFPDNLKLKNIKNTQLSYSNSPECEYLGSHIFELCGLKTHNTKLGSRDGKIVVLCEDFCVDGVTLAEFQRIKVTFEPTLVDSEGNETNGLGADLDETLLVIRQHHIFQFVQFPELFFWKMFIVDALIGNPDRNNGNWGVLIKDDSVLGFAPVYDNGNCLNNKWDDNKMLNALSSEKSMQASAYKGVVCFFTKNGNRVNPFHIIQSGDYVLCSEALRLLLNQINIDAILNLVDDEYFSQTRRTFYKKMLMQRYNELCRINSKLQSN